MRKGGIMRRGFVLLSVVVFLAAGVSSQANMLTNGDFETPQAAGWTGTGWSSWAWAGGYSEHVNNKTVLQGGNGTYLLNCGNGWWNGGGGAGGAYQTVAATEGMTYKLTVDSAADAWWLPTGRMAMIWLNSSGGTISEAARNTVDPAIYGGTYDTPHPVANYTLVGTAPVGTTQVKVEFSSACWNQGGTITFDNASLTVNISGPHNPIPIPGTLTAGTLAGGKVDVTLRWKAGMNPSNPSQVNPLIKKHYVYLGVAASEPNMLYQGFVNQVSLNDPNVSFLKTGLLENTQYQWRIEEALDNGIGGALAQGDPNNIQGDIWTFRTTSSIPTIDTEPVSNNIPIGTTSAQAFSIVASSATTIGYQWYYSTNAVIDAGDTPVGTNAPTLTIATMALSDEGFYYCKVYNAATISGGGSSPDKYSNVVILVAGRQVGQYLFEQNLNDSVGTNNGVALDTSLPDPNLGVLTYAAGIQGSYAVSLNGIGQYVNFGTGAFPRAGSFPNGLGGGMDEGTISCWVKISKVGALLANYNNGSSTGFSMSIATDNGGDTNAGINVRGESATGGEQVIGTRNGRPGMTGFNMLTDGKWHMISAAWRQGGTMTLYVDGGQVDSSNAGTAALFQPWQYGVLLGANRNATDRRIPEIFFGGLIDNLKIYNYARTPAQMANEYYTLTGTAACMTPNFVGNAFNHDNSDSSYCRIDLADFAAFAQQWLTSGLSTGL
jgi:hypothetical protein